MASSTHLVASLRAEQTGRIEKLGLALYAGGLWLQAEAQRLTPVDLGILKASAQTELIEDDTTPEVNVSFSTKYAIYVHEDLSANHPNGGQAKFLEEPARTRQPEINAVIQGVMTS